MARVAEDLRKVLTKAAELLEGNWQQDAYGVGDGPYCAVGALRIASGITYEGTQWLYRTEYRLCDQAMRVLEPLLPQEPPIEANVVRWNDMDGQTEANVVATLRKAADRTVG